MSEINNYDPNNYDPNPYDDVTIDEALAQIYDRVNDRTIRQIVTILKKVIDGISTGDISRYTVEKTTAESGEVTYKLMQQINNGIPTPVGDTVCLRGSQILANYDEELQILDNIINIIKVALDSKADAADIPSKTSDLTNDSGYLTAETDPTVPAWAKAANKPTYTASEVGALPDDTDIPTKTSDLTNDSGFITGMTILSYGSSTWNDFITAYNANKVVYCRASSNSNPATGSQTRLAFMAYVDNGATPTNVEFQYYRSVSSHSASQQGDQVYVYKLTSAGTPVITAAENTRYICGEVTSLSFTPCASGICDVRFTSGSTVTVLTLPNTVKMPDWFDASVLEANTIYEINILDGVYGVVTTWAV